MRAASSETRADRLADRIEANVATASTSVPAAVATEAQVDQSAMLPQLSEARLPALERARDPESVTEVHAWPAVVARQLADDLADVAGSELVAVYLHGSAVLGGWVPDRSDVDVLIIAADRTSETHADSMARAIAGARPHRWPPAWPAPKLETSIVTATAAGAPGPPWPFLRHVLTGPMKAARVIRPDIGGGDRDLLMHYVACREAGYAAFGPQPQDVIGPIPHAAIITYLADELRWGLTNAPERYAVLNACRAVVYLTDGAFVSKIAGGEAAVQRQTGPPDVITRALAQQRGGQPDQPAAADAIAFVEATITMLRAGRDNDSAQLQA